MGLPLVAGRDDKTPPMPCPNANERFFSGIWIYYGTNYRAVDASVFADFLG